jgi:uncharacterized protein
MPASAYENPADYPLPWDPIGSTSILVNHWQYATWIIIHVLADMKFVTIFSIMFGAGIAIQAERAALRGRRPWAVHYSRMAALLLIGMFHAYFIWFGDILVMYCECGMLVFPARRLRAPLLIVLGVAMIGVYPVVSYYETIYYQRQMYVAEYGMPDDGPPQADQSPDDVQAPPAPPEAPWIIVKLRQTSESLLGDKVGHDEELSEFRGGYRAEMAARPRISFENETTSFLEWEFWRFGGSMLIGMGLSKLKFFHGHWPREAYAGLAAFAMPVGWMITLVGVMFNQMHHWDWSTLAFEGLQFNYWGSLISAFGYLSLGTLVAIWVGDHKHKLLELAVVPVRAIGRTALSNYILQSLIDTTFFYGHGFGYFGYISRLGALGVVLCIWTVNMTLSVLWLRHFKQGPLEWLWHRMVYFGQVKE